MFSVRKATVSSSGTRYLDIYHRPLARFVGQPVHLADVGVLGGGGLEMWREYLGHLVTVTRGTEWPSYLPVATMHSRSGDRSPLTTSDPAEEPV